MSTKALSLFPKTPHYDEDDPRLTRPWMIWYNEIREAVLRTKLYTVIFDPISIAANTTAEQTVTVTGLTTQDFVEVNKPSLTAGIGIVNARVSADNTLAITFINATGSAIDPGSETYLVKATRQ